MNRTIMKKQHILYLLAAISTPAFAQLDNTVEVTNTVKPIVTEAKKVEMKNQALTPNAKQYSMEFNVQSTQPSAYAQDTLRDYSSPEVIKGDKNGYLQVAGGIQGTIDTHAAYKIDLTETDIIGIDLALQGFNGHTPNNKDFNVAGWKSRFYDNHATLKYNHRFYNGVDLFVKGNLENQMFNYMSLQKKNSPTDKQHNILADFNAGLTPYKMDNVTIGVEAGLKLFKQQYVSSLEDKLRETVMHINANGAYHIDDEQNIEVGVGFISTAYRNDELKGVSRFHITPHYVYSSDMFNLKAGVFVSSIGNVAPDVELTYKIDPKSALYAACVGGEDVNDFRYLTAINPYFAIAPKDGRRKLDAEFKQIDVKAGYKFCTLVGLSGDINLGYKTSKNHANISSMLSDKNCYMHYPDIDFTKNKCFYINADFAYAYQDVVKLNLKNAFNFESNKAKDEDWMRGSYIVPFFEMDYKMDFQIIDNLYFGVNWGLQTFNSPEIEMSNGELAYDRPATIELGASVRYVLPTELPLSVFIKGNNLMNQNYDRYFGYRNIGAIFLGGFALSF